MNAAKLTMGSSHPTVALSMIQIGFLALQAGSPRNAITAFRNAVDIQIACLGPSHPLVAKLHTNLAAAQRVIGNLREAKVEFGRALRIQRAVVESLEQNNRYLKPDNVAERKNSREARVALASTLSSVGAMMARCSSQGDEFYDELSEAIAMLIEAFSVSLRSSLFHLFYQPTASADN